MKRFIEEDWTGLTQKQIYNQIVAELEEQQCRTEGHRWVPAFYCSVCGIQSSDALEEFKKQITTKKRKMSRRHVK